MSELVITSKQNNLVKYIRGLREKRNRDSEGCFIIEGARFVQEALLSGVHPERVIVTDRYGNSGQSAEFLAQFTQDVPVTVVDEQVMEYMSETESPQGIMAVIKMPVVVLQDFLVRDTSVFVVIDAVQDPGNVGTIIRTADAFGVEAVILTKGCADLYNAKTLRSTMGSIFHIPVVRDFKIEEMESFFSRHNFFTAVTGLEDSAESLNTAILSRPLVLIFGSETHGVSGELRELADTVLKIPMAGQAESLNVGIAAGIVLYEAFCQRGSKPNSNL